MARPRSFDEEKVLRAARDQFWTLGYAATSLDDLMAATGLGKGSLYGAFGSKRELFLRVLDEYCARAVEDVSKALAGPDASADVLHSAGTVLIEDAQEQLTLAAERAIEAAFAQAGGRHEVVERGRRVAA